MRPVPTARVDAVGPPHGRVVHGPVPAVVYVHNPTRTAHVEGLARRRIVSREGVTGAPVLYAIAVLAFVCNLFSKQSAITLPVMLVAYEVLVERRSGAM